MNGKALSIMRYDDDINTENNMKVPLGSGSVDIAPDSQWTNASSNLARRIFLILRWRRGWD